VRLRESLPSAARRFVAVRRTRLCRNLNGEALAPYGRRTLGDACATEVVDVTEPESVDRMVRRATTEFGATPTSR